MNYLIFLVAMSEIERNPGIRQCTLFDILEFKHGLPVNAKTNKINRLRLWSMLTKSSLIEPIRKNKRELYYKIA